MPIRPELSLQVEQPKYGQIIGTGIQNYRARKRQEAADERANALIELKRQEFQQQQQEKDRKEILRDTAIKGAELLPMLDQDPMKAQEIISQNIEKGGKDAAAWADLWKLNQQDPTRAKQALQGAISQARFEKLVPGEKSTKTSLEEAKLRKVEKQIQKIDTEIAEKVTKAKTATEKEALMKQGQIQKADIVIGKVDKALEQTGFFTTGATGALIGKVPGTPAFDLEKTIDTIKANIGFNELQQMRAASPTGGALGQVAVRELEFLQSALSSLEKGQSQDQLIENLEAVKTHYNNWKSTMQGKPVEPKEKTTGTTGGWSIKRTK